MALTPILTSTTAGALFTALPPLSLTVTQAEVRAVTNQLLIQTELSQPEGTPIQMTINNLSNASTLATQLNQKFKAGQLKDTATGEPLEAWAGFSTVAQAQGSTLILRWRKGQPFVVVIAWAIVIIAVIITVYLIVRELMGSSWSMSKWVGSTASGQGASPGPLGIPWWEWLVGGGAILVGGPYVIRHLDAIVTSEAQLRRDVRHDG